MTLRRISLPAKIFALLVLASGAGCGEPAPNPVRAPAAARYGPDGRLLAGRSPPGPRPNLLLVVVPGLRGDAVPEGALGGAAALRHAVTPSPEPSAALASLLTGLHPVRHRTGHRDVVPRLPPEQVTLPEILSAQAGYAVRAFVADARLARGATLWQGAEVDPARTGLVEARRTLLPWVASLPAGRPFCALLVADEADPPYGEEQHAPPMPGPSTQRVDIDQGPLSHLHLYLRSRAGFRLLEEQLVARDGPDAAAVLRRSVLQSLWRPRDAAASPATQDLLPGVVDGARTAYAEGAAWVTRLVHDLLAGLSASGHADDTLVLLTSTGGTAFLEHGLLGPGRQLYDEQVRIPFVLSGPGPWAGRGALEQAASLCDVLPTVLDLLGLPAPDELDGRSLLPVLRGEARRGAVISEAAQDGDNTGDPAVRATLVSVRTSRWKYIVRYDVRAGTVLEEAYDLRADPAEAHDLAGGSGRVEGVAFDDEACAAIERVRDGLWLRVESGNRMADTGYAQGSAVLTGRPAPCRPR